MGISHTTSLPPLQQPDRRRFTCSSVLYDVRELSECPTSRLNAPVSAKKADKSIFCPFFLGAVYREEQA